jgi:hypothetical protein
MPNPNESKEFMLILRGGIPPKDLRPEQIQAIIAKFGEWMAEMQKRGQLRGAGRLEDDGRRLSRKQGKTVTDGPYVEAKEIIGGYFLVMAPNLDQALDIAKQCPILDNEGTVEVRPIQPPPPQA